MIVVLARKTMGGSNDVISSDKERWIKAEEDHRAELERIEKENKEIEELSQEKGVYDIPTAQIGFHRFNDAL